MSVKDEMFEPVWNPRFRPALARPPEPRLPRRYSTEKAAERALEAVLTPYFRIDQELFRQVRLTETGYPPQYIDYVIVLPESFSLRCIGIEVKSGFDDVKSACAVIRQAMRYRKAYISDARLIPMLGKATLPYIMLWPPFRWDQGTEWCDLRPNPELVRAEYLARCSGEARALALFAQHFNIGHIEVSHWWSSESRDWEQNVTFMNGQQQVWTSRFMNGLLSGFRGGAKLAADTKRGKRFLD